MTEDVDLAEPKLVPLTAAEQDEAVRLLAALLRASIAAHATSCDENIRADAFRGESVPRKSGRGSPRSRAGSSHKAAAGLPMARGANGKRGSRETAGGRP